MFLALSTPFNEPYIYHFEKAKKDPNERYARNYIEWSLIVEEFLWGPDIWCPNSLNINLLFLVTSGFKIWLVGAILSK